jgi:alpha,alpha-trehalase
MSIDYSIIALLFMASCRAQAPDLLYDELFRSVQTQRIFSDSKTFCDAIPRALTPSVILERYRQDVQQDAFNLSAFVHEHFLVGNTSIIVHDRWTIEQHCHRLWPLLTRTTEKVPFSSLIDVPHPFVVPGGRFQEFYYWDTYFTMLGLLRSNEHELIRHMLDNFAFLIEQLGHVPNGNRNYYQQRSQQFWMNKRRVVLDDGTVLNRYYDDTGATPRPEAYLEDKHTADKKNNTDVYVHLRAAAESGWDFSSRWMEDEADLSTIVTAYILPVDLNCLLYHLERALNKNADADRRRQAIQKYMWSPENLFYTDYNFIQKKQTQRLTLAGVFPVWLNVSTAEQAQHVARRIETSFLRDGGVVTTIATRSEQQWDSPNGWAPLQFIAYRALLNTTGYERVATKIRQRWMALNERVFAETGKMMEKYDVVNIDQPAGGGEYQTQDGFGWTNGVYLEMLHDQRSSSMSNPSSATFHWICLLQLVSQILF